MDSNEIGIRIMRGVDEDPASPSEGLVDEVRDAIVEGQEFFSFLTLCLEVTASWTLSGTFGSLRPAFPDFLVPLRLVVDGVRVRPATLSNLDALDSNWQSVSGAQRRYATLGFNFYAVTPQQATAASFTYARSPALVVDENVPIEIPEEYHPSLVKYGIYKIRLKEGAQGLERGLKYFGEFLDDAQRLGDFVRARSRAAQYDVLPIELKLFDRSRLMLTPPKASRR
jgi:hypothetical protein